MNTLTRKIVFRYLLMVTLLLPIITFVYADGLVNKLVSQDEATRKKALDSLYRVDYIVKTEKRAKLIKIMKKESNYKGLYAAEALAELGNWYGQPVGTVPKIKTTEKINENERSLRQLNDTAVRNLFAVYEKTYYENKKWIQLTLINSIPVRQDVILFMINALEDDSRSIRGDAFYSLVSMCDLPNDINSLVTAPWGFVSDSYWLSSNVADTIKDENLRTEYLRSFISSPAGKANDRFTVMESICNNRPSSFLLVEELIRSDKTWNKMAGLYCAYKMGKEATKFKTLIESFSDDKHIPIKVFSRKILSRL